MGGMGLIFTPVLVRRLLGPPGLSRPMTNSSWPHTTPNSPVTLKGVTRLRLPTHPLICAIRDITVVVKKVAQNPTVLASYQR